MLTVEKALILSSVELFQGLPGDLLASLAKALDEIEVTAGQTIVQKGDLGTSMYVIVSGRVRVHDGDREITTLGEREVFGELSALDPHERNASVTVLEDGLLLEMKHYSLYDVIAEDVELAKKIICFLCQRYARPVS